MELLNKVALITGGRRFGAAIGGALAARGVDLSMSYLRSSDAAEIAAATVREAGRSALVTKVDVSNDHDVSLFVDKTVERFGRIDIVLNMASVYRRTVYDDLTNETWREAISVDLEGAYHCVRAAVPHMRASGGGHIVNFSDWTAASGRPRYRGYLPYYVAKRAVLGLTEALALELAPDRILVNTIAPGPISPPSNLSASSIEEVKRATPLGRWGGADEIASAVIGLLEMDFVTGEMICVDGGRHVK